jgi:tRNA(fMet)-specific endonuclease VapC
VTLYVFDTDLLTLLAEGHPAVTNRLLRERPDDVATTVLTVEEQLSGWYTAVRKAKRPEQLARAYRELARSVKYLSRFSIIEYDEAGMLRYEQLRKQKVKIRRMDLRIAATVLQQNDAILVTRNVRDFEQVPGLHIEDWSKPR